MVDWTDPGVISKYSSILEQTNFICLGLYMWEYARSWQVELALICRRIQPRWPLVSSSLHACALSQKC
ncbi:uncharacterized protein BJ212DRAFT_1274353 [Suillus subaureus]|uniref:Uncharacterized protein n=1 Tax=Suillus subaureus TaxID=48587 RepID=A0A9P7JC03_9AGAM|nr:uncharacterized protein BJ212DRAFT_1274353 [Suillus subaureus]KAG1814290.1 hypothetical protein BJ212DRAFT_1274353 [Suillus subaureus]